VYAALLLLHSFFFSNDVFADGKCCDLLLTGSIDPELYRYIGMHQKGSQHTAVLTSAYLGPFGSLSVLTIVMQVSRHKISDMLPIAGRRGHGTGHDAVVDCGSTESQNMVDT
jgi:hypothetical protein